MEINDTETRGTMNRWRRRSETGDYRCAKRSKGPHGKGKSKYKENRRG